MPTRDNSILKSTGIMTMATLLSRATGLLRTWAMAFALGNTLITSAYQVANTMPNAIFELVAGGVIGTAFLPIYLLQKEKLGKRGSDRFASNILNLSVIFLGLLAILATIFAPQVIATQTFTVSDQAAVFETSVTFFRIFAIQVVFYGLGGIVTGVLNANRVYGIPALAPVFNNLIVIISLFAYVPFSAINPEGALLMLGIGTSLGVVIQFAVQLPTLIKQGFRYTFTINLRDPALKEALRIAIPTFIYIAGNLVSYSCRNAFSLGMGDGGPSTLNYAWMWYQLPYGVVAVSISTAFLTEMSDAVSRNDLQSLRRFVTQGLRGTLFLIIPLTGMMIALAGPLIQIFRAGAFSQEDVILVSTVLATWVISLPLYAGQMYFYRVFAALRQFMTFALVSCSLCVVQVGLYAFLCKPEMLGLLGIPVADCIYYGLQFIIMALILRRRIGSFEMGRIVGMSAKALIATGIGTVAIKALLAIIPLRPSILLGLLEIIILGSVGLFFIFALCKLFRIPEMDLVSSLFRKVRRKVSRQKQGTALTSDASPSPSENKLPGKHARPGSWDTHSSNKEEWNKVGKHAAPLRSNNAAPARLRSVDPSSTGAIVARARHARP